MGFKARKRGSVVIVLTEDEIRKRIDDYARDVFKLPVDEVLKRLDAGEWHGTVASCNMRGWVELLKGPSRTLYPIR